MRTYTIAGQSVTVQRSSLNYNDRRNERTTCSFTVVEPTFEIDVGMEVWVKEGADTVFAGTIDNLKEYGKNEKYVAVSCVDFSQLIDKRAIPLTFVNTLAGNIARAFITEKFAEEGITAGTIHDGPVITKAVFPYDNGNIAMNYLADLTGFSWSIDHNKRLNFYDRSTYLAPFSLTDKSLNYEGMQVQKTRGQYRNQQYVRGGKDLTQEIVKEKPTPKPDGVSKTFVVRLPIALKPRIFIDDIEVDPSLIGVNGFDKNKKYYFSFGSNTITQDDAEPILTEVQKLEITYRGLYPMRVAAENAEGITERKAIEGGSGIYENVVDEESLDTREAAFEFANAKLDKFSVIPKVITFNTHEPGLKAGQLLPIQNTKFRLDGSYLIESVTARDNGGLTQYAVKCLDGSTLGGWEQFFKSLIKGNKKLVIRENEILVLLITQFERQNWAEKTDISVYACPVPSEELYPSETLYPC
jgi:hypothetical protein